MRVGIALGSNLGDRLGQLMAARAMITALPEVSPPIDSSRIYETEPVQSEPGAGAFLNAAMEVEYSGDPVALIVQLQTIEKQLGRPAERARNASRVIDLDLLYAGDRVVNGDVMIPHPRLHERRFVLAPLADLRPGLLLPGQALSILELMSALPENAGRGGGENPVAGMTHDFSQFREWKHRGEKIAMLTAYDYPTARLLEEGGIDLLLVGDSLGMVVLGYQDTTLVTMDEMLHHTRAVARGAQKVPIIADLPFASYESPEAAVENGQRLVEAGAHAVKLEGGQTHAAQIHALTRAGIPVMAHIGMMPQSVRLEGGYRIKGKTPEGAERLLADAAAVEAAGAFGLLLELVQAETAQRIHRGREPSRRSDSVQELDATDKSL
jgi:3-methyl-2-oxobutanoate hydroxymethyltransferase